LSLDAAEHTHYVRVYKMQRLHKRERDAAGRAALLTEPGIGYRLRREWTLNARPSEHDPEGRRVVSSVVSFVLLGVEFALLSRDTDAQNTA
jgi:hypothetical protein